MTVKNTTQGESPKGEAGAKPEEHRAAALGTRVGAGVSLTVALSFVMRILSMVSQFALAKLLSTDDFGLNALAVSCFVLGGVIRDAQLPEWLVQRGLREYDGRIGTVFRLSLLINTGVCVLLAVAAPVVAAWKEQPVLLWMLLCVAVSFPLNTAGGLVGAKLRMELRYKELTAMGLGSSVIRYVGSIVLAVVFREWGLGPVAFVLPLPIMALWESGYMLWRSRVKPWQGGKEPKGAIWIIMQSRWLVFTALAMAVLNIGDYALLSALIDEHELGVYFWSYQLVAMTGAMLANNIGQVMYPALAAIHVDKARLASAVKRSAGALMLLSAPASVGMGVIVEPAERLVFSGKWHDAVIPTLIFAATYPIRALITAPQEALKAVGKFRENGLLTFGVGACVMAASVGGALTGGDATTIASWTGVVRTVTCIGVMLYGMSVVGLRIADTISCIVPSWAIALAAGAATLWLDDAVFAKHLPDILRIICCGAWFSAVYILACRALLPGILRDAFGVMPGILRRPGMKMLKLGEATPENPRRAAGES